MPSADVGAQTEAIASRTALSMAGSSFNKPSERWVNDDHTRFSPTGTGPVRPREAGDGPMCQARISTQSSKTFWSTPFGLSAVLSMYGTTAEINTAFVTLLPSWRDMYRATSPPPIEKPTIVTSVDPAYLMTSARSSARRS